MDVRLHLSSGQVLGIYTVRIEATHASFYSRNVDISCKCPDVSTAQYPGRDNMNSILRQFFTCTDGEFRWQYVPFWEWEPLRSVCLIRPEDVVLPYWDIAGMQMKALYNKKTEGLWLQPVADEIIIQLICYSAAKGAFIFSAFPSETVASLTQRLANTLRLSGVLLLWHESTPLLPHLSLESSSLSSRSRISLQLAEDEIGLVLSVFEQRTVPVQRRKLSSSYSGAAWGIIPFSRNDMILQAAVLHFAWRDATLCREYRPYRLSPPNASRFFLVQMPNERIISFQADGSTYEAVVPAVCTVADMKRCIEAQHGLSSFSCTVLSELSDDRLLVDYGIASEDEIVLVHISKASKELTVPAIINGNRQITLPCTPSTTIAQLKATACQQYSIQGLGLFFTQHNEILVETRTVAQCGLDGCDPLVLKTTKGVSNRMKQDSGSLVKMSFNSATPAATSSHWMQTRLAMREVYSTPLSKTDLITVQANGYALSFRANTRVRVVKRLIRERLHVADFTLKVNGLGLRDGLSLSQQKVQTTDVLTIEPLEQLRLSVTVATGAQRSVIIERWSAVSDLKRTIATAMEVVPQHQRLIFAKRLSEEEALPLEFDSLLLSQTGSLA